MFTCHISMTKALVTFQVHCQCFAFIEILVMDIWNIDNEMKSCQCTWIIANGYMDTGNEVLHSNNQLYLWFYNNSPTFANQS